MVTRAKPLWDKRGTFDLPFVDHPRSLGESYWEHQSHALRCGSRMMAAGAACLIHALVPALFPRTASQTIRQLYWRMSQRGLPCNDPFVAQTDGSRPAVLRPQ
jgi:uncharacterized protein DUF6356